MKILDTLKAKLGPLVVSRQTDELAKRIRNAMLDIPFYRQRLIDNNIPIEEVEKIKSSKDLDNFFDVHGHIPLVTSEDFFKEDYSLNLSQVPSELRRHIQSSSGYTLVEKLPIYDDMDNGTIDDLLENFSDKLRRKSVAFTRKDYQSVINGFLNRGIKSLCGDKESPLFAILARMGDLCGSGSWPWLALNTIESDIKVLNYGDPRGTGQLEQWAFELKKHNPYAILSTPSIVEGLAEFTRKIGIKYEGLEFISVGGSRALDSTISAAKDLGAKALIVGYSAQEVMPLLAIGTGVIWSESENIPPTDGITILGNLVHARVVDNDYKPVSPGERGKLILSTAFDGTSLINYDIGDNVTLISNESYIVNDGVKIKVPWPTIGFDISRSENETVSVLEHPVSIIDLEEICTSLYNHDFLIGTTGVELFITIPEGNDWKETALKSHLRAYLPHEIYKKTSILKMPEHELEMAIYPNGHYKPHNLIKGARLEELLGDRRWEALAIS